MKFPNIFQKIIFFAFLLFCLTPYVDSPTALVLGFLMTLILGNPYEKQIGKSVKWLLKAAIIGLGFGMNFYSAIKAGSDGFLITIITIVSVMILGFILGKILKIDAKTSYLVSSGTAICGGSAIAAVAPIIDANQKQLSVSLGTVFVLNAVALLLFPLIGHLFDLTQYQFGLWSAIAIHDTSSVVGAAAKYGSEALEIATTIKLGRALWIIPLSILTVILTKKSGNKINIPYFILLFIVAMLINTFFPQFTDVYGIIVLLAKKALVVSLFLIGAGLSVATIQSVGVKTFLQGVILWVVISIASLVAIVNLY